jgi:hypothetical protein
VRLGVADRHREDEEQDEKETDVDQAGGDAPPENVNGISLAGLSLFARRGIRAHTVILTRSLRCNARRSGLRRRGLDFLAERDLFQPEQDDRQRDEAERRRR